MLTEKKLSISLNVLNFLTNLPFSLNDGLLRRETSIWNELSYHLMLIYHLLSCVYLAYALPGSIATGQTLVAFFNVTTLLTLIGLIFSKLKFPVVRRRDNSPGESNTTSELNSRQAKEIAKWPN